MPLYNFSADFLTLNDGTAVEVSTADPPTAGQVLQATDADSAVWATPSNLSALNKNMLAETTLMDGDLACLTAVLSTPPANGWVSVYVNGVAYTVGNGTTSASCFFSPDGDTPRATGDVIAGDFLFWNGSIVGFELSNSGNDRIDFVYETP